jgi:hypothetical protein
VHILVMCKGYCWRSFRRKGAQHSLIQSHSLKSLMGLKSMKAMDYEPFTKQSQEVHRLQLGVEMYRPRCTIIHLVWVWYNVCIHCEHESL